MTSTLPNARDAANTLFAGPGEMRALCRALDWSATPLGPVDEWPERLRSAIELCMGSAFPKCVHWGPELIAIYNDRFIDLLGPRHPAALGRPATEVWADQWDEIGPDFESVLAGGHTGEPLIVAEQRVSVLRDGAARPAWFNFVYQPLTDAEGHVAGVLQYAVDVSSSVRARQEIERANWRLQTQAAELEVHADALREAALQLEEQGREAMAARAEAEAERSRLREVLRQLPAGVAVTRGDDYRFVFANAAFEATTGGRMVLGKTPREAFPDLGGQGFLGMIERLFSTLEAQHATEMRTQLHVGGGEVSEVFLDLSLVPLKDPQGHPNGLLSFHVDVTERVRQRLAAAEAERHAAQVLAQAYDAERAARSEVEQRVAERTAELARANAALEAEAAERARAEAERTALRRQLASAEEDERRRLARELHDQLGQHLAAFTLGLEETRRLLPDDSISQRRLAQLQALAVMMTRDARYLALELRPPELDDVGLASALSTYVEQWSSRFGVPAELTTTGIRDQRLPVDLATTIYRVVQEALTNVAKHADARQVSVVVDKSGTEVRLLVEDDGRGFDVESTLTRAREDRRLGLAGMRERAVLAGGTLAVESSPGRGATVYVRLPSSG